MKTTMCTIPEDLLMKQVMIDSIPGIMMILLLLILTVFCLLWWLSVRDKLSPAYSKTAIIAFFVVFFPLWMKTSFLIAQVATNLFNSEYAVLVKFSQGCPSALQSK